MKLTFAAGTDVGKTRDHNEDSYGVDSEMDLFMVCDGMGGHAAGEVASAIAVHTVRNTVAENKDLLKAYIKGDESVQKYDIIQMLEHAVQKACSTIYDKAQAEPEKRGMGTTCSLLLLVGHRGFIAHVGDSRIYLIRKGGIHQLTEDHSLVNELVRKGRLKRGEIDDSPYAKYKNAVTRAIGVYESVEPDTLDFDVLPEDSYMLCSDGLSAYLTEKNLLETLEIEDVEAIPKSFIDIANEGGGHDNITSVVVRVSEALEEEAEQRAAQVHLTMEVIEQIPFFRYLTYKERVRMMNIMQLRKYEFGSPIIQERERGEALYVILTGAVDLLKEGAYITTLTQGSHFGEMALVDRSPRSATAVAKEDAEILSIDRKDFYRVIRKEPSLAVKLLWNFLGVLADRLRKTTAALSGARLEADAVDMSDEVTLFDESSSALSLGGMPPTGTHFRPESPSSSEPTEELVKKDTRLNGEAAAKLASDADQAADDAADDGAEAADDAAEDAADDGAEAADDAAEDAAADAAEATDETAKPEKPRSEEPTLDLKKRSAEPGVTMGQPGQEVETEQSIIDTLPGTQTFADMEIDVQQPTESAPEPAVAAAQEDAPKVPDESLRETVGAKPSTRDITPDADRAQPSPPADAKKTATPGKRTGGDPMLGDTAPGTLTSPFAKSSADADAEGKDAAPSVPRETKPESPKAIPAPKPEEVEELLDVTLKDTPPEELKEADLVEVAQPPPAPPVQSPPPAEEKPAAKAEKRVSAAKRITQMYGTSRDDVETKPKEEPEKEPKEEPKEESSQEAKKEVKEETKEEAKKEAKKEGKKEGKTDSSPGAPSEAKDPEPEPPEKS